MKITPKQRRERLFKFGKPVVRAAEQNDMRWLWVAARRSGFEGTPEEFESVLLNKLAESGISSYMMLEDKNSEFSSGAGPIGFVLIIDDGWAIMPHVEWFPWATSRNKLRSTVAFLQIMRYSRDVGVVKISANPQNREWFKWLKRYVAVYPVGRIPAGRPDGDEYLFYLRGRRNESRERSVWRRRDADGEPTRRNNSAPSPGVRPTDNGIERVNHWRDSGAANSWNYA